MCELDVHTDRGITQFVFLSDGRFASIERCRNRGFIRLDGRLVYRQLDWRLGEDRGVVRQAFQRAVEKGLYILVGHLGQSDNRTDLLYLR